MSICLNCYYHVYHLVALLLTGSSEENYAGHLVKDGESQGFRYKVYI